jgi:hypothetical protein
MMVTTKERRALPRAHGRRDRGVGEIPGGALLSRVIDRIDDRCRRIVHAKLNPFLTQALFRAQSLQLVLPGATTPNDI